MTKMLRRPQARLRKDNAAAEDDRCGIAHCQDSKELYDNEGEATAQNSGFTKRGSADPPSLARECPLFAGLPTLLEDARVAFHQLRHVL